MTESQPLIKNPHLEGGPFFWKGSRTGILLIHGFTATTAEVRPLGQALHESGYTVSGPVLPGHNTSPKDINHFTWRDWVATAEQAYQELDLDCDRIFVGGESTGGLLALYLAAQHPDISGVLAYAPALRLAIRSIDQFKLRLLAPFIPYLPKQGKDDDLPWKGYTVNPLKGVLQLLQLQKQVAALLPKIRCPLLIIQGRLDATVDPQVPEIINQGVASSMKEIYWMPNSNHCVALDVELTQVISLTLNFLAKNPAQQSY